MLDAKTQELASLYVLDLLPEQEKLEVDLLISRNAEVRQLIRSLNVNVEAMALSVPPVKAPSGIWNRIEARINAKHQTPKAGWWRQTWLPLAACFILGAILSWISLRSAKPQHKEMSTLETVQTANPEHQAERSYQKANNAVVDPSRLSTLLAEQKRDIQKLDQALNQERARHRALENQFEDLNSNAKHLTDQLARYRTTEPGMKRLLIMNLANPTSNGASLNFAQIANKILADEAQKQLASESTNGLKNASVSTNTQIASTVSAGISISGYNLSSATSVAEFMTSSNLNPISIAENGKSSNSQSVLQSASFNEDNQAGTFKATDVATIGPAGVLIFDQADQKGSLVLQGVPQPSPGSYYQVWFFDSQNGQPIHLGTLPALSNGGGQVQFNLQNPSMSPARLMITLEPGMNITAPTGAILLDGPQAGSSP